MNALDRKLLRDLWRLKGQVASISAVMAAGVASVIAMRSTLESMQRTRDEYYATAHFPSVFATLTRAPESLAQRIAAIDGVATVETRVVTDVLMQVPRSGDAASAHLVSVARQGETLSRLHIQRGRRLDPAAADEALVNGHFATANGIGPGDTLSVVVNGRLRHLRIVGLALSPEFVYDALPGVGMFSDSKHSAIVWMNRDALAPLYQMDGAFNDVTILTAPGANENEVIARLDDLLRPYGGGHAYARKDQLSNTIVSGELEQLRVFGTAMPLIFLSIAAFLLNIVLTRLIATQREEIATLKAFGYTNGRLAVHFLGYPGAAIVFGSVGGVALGMWAGAEYTQVYTLFFKFPTFEHYTSASLILVSVGVSALAAVAGTLSAVRRAVSLRPAEGMRPDAPAEFKPLLLERMGMADLVPPAGRMILRDLERKRFRTVASILGVAASAAILVVGTFAFDSARYMADLQFRVVDREDLSVGFASLRPARARRELEGLRGVTRVELFRMSAVRLRSGHRSRRIAITGLERGAQLRRVVDRAGHAYELPPSGLVLTTALGNILHVKVGDTVTAELLERGGEVRRLPVVGLADELLGLSAYMELGALHAVMREGPVASGAYLAVASGAERDVVAQLRELPGVSGTATRRAMIENFDAQIAASLRLTVTIVVSLAVVVALGVVYNGIRISLSERSRELASLRVLGFTRQEVAALLFGEQGVIDVIGTPLGLLMGLGLAYWISTGFATEMYRFPVVVSTRTYLFSAGVIAVAVLGATLVMRRKVYGLDLIAALKTRE